MSDATAADHYDGVSARAPGSGFAFMFQRVSGYGFALVPGAKSGAFRILPALRAFVRSLMLTVALLSVFSLLLGWAHADGTASFQVF